MASILKSLRKQPRIEQVLSTTNAGFSNAIESLLPVEELSCSPWTTRRLKVPTSATGYLIIECFESAEGKRLKGLGRMEPGFSLSNLKIMLENPFGIDDLRLFPILDTDLLFSEIDFMSHEVRYPKWGHLNIALSLLLGKTKVQCRLWF